MDPEKENMLTRCWLLNRLSLLLTCPIASSKAEMSSVETVTPKRKYRWTFCTNGKGDIMRVGRSKANYRVPPYI